MQGLEEEQEQEAAHSKKYDSFLGNNTARNATKDASVINTDKASLGFDFKLAKFA